MMGQDPFRPLITSQVGFFHGQTPEDLVYGYSSAPVIALQLVCARRGRERNREVNICAEATADTRTAAIT